MGAISCQQVEHIANLARLSLTPEETERFTEQLNKILEFAHKLNELDTDGVEPTSHVLPLANVMRDDAVRPSIAREEALKNAPDCAGGLFRVPKVIEG